VELVRSLTSKPGGFGVLVGVLVKRVIDTAVESEAKSDLLVVVCAQAVCGVEVDVGATQALRKQIVIWFYLRELSPLWQKTVVGREYFLKLERG